MELAAVTNALIGCSNRQEVSRLEAELESLRDRYSSTNEQLASTSDDRVRLTEQIDQLKQQLQRLSDERTAAQRSAMKQVSASSFSQLLSLILSTKWIGLSVRVPGCQKLQIGEATLWNCLLDSCVIYLSVSALVNANKYVIESLIYLLTYLFVYLPVGP